MGVEGRDQYSDADYEHERQELIDDNRRKGCKGKLVNIRLVDKYVYFVLSINPITVGGGGNCPPPRGFSCTVPL